MLWRTFDAVQTALRKPRCLGVLEWCQGIADDVFRPDLVRLATCCAVRLVDHGWIAISSRGLFGRV